MSVIMFGVFIAAALALSIVPLGLRFGTPVLARNVALIMNCLLVAAGAFSGLLSLIC